MSEYLSILQLITQTIIAHAVIVMVIILVKTKANITIEGSIDIRIAKVTFKIKK